MAIRTISRRVFIASLGLIAVMVAACSLVARPPTPTPAPRLDRVEVEFRIVRNVELKRGHAMRVTFDDGRQTRTLA